MGVGLLEMSCTILTLEKVNIKSSIIYLGCKHEVFLGRSGIGKGITMRQVRCEEHVGSWNLQEIVEAMTIATP